MDRIAFDLRPRPKVPRRPVQDQDLRGLELDDACQRLDQTPTDEWRLVLKCLCNERARSASFQIALDLFGDRLVGISDIQDHDIDEKAARVREYVGHRVRFRSRLKDHSSPRTSHVTVLNSLPDDGLL
jgi:hypothetical protein